MDIQNNKINRIQSDSQIKRNMQARPSDIQERQGDLSDAMNAYAYICKSQIVHKKYTRPTPPAVANGLDLSKEDLKPVKLVENEPLIKEDAIVFLQHLGFSDNVISKINFLNPKVLMISTAYKNFLESLSQEEHDAAINEIKESDEEKQLELFEEEDDLYKYYNKENVEMLSKYYDDIDGMDDMWDILSNLTNRDEEETNLILKKLPFIVSVQGKLDDKNYFRGMNEEVFKHITPKRTKLIKEINAFIPEKDRMSAINANKLGNDSELTKDNVDKYLALISKYIGNKTLTPRSVLPNYRNETISQLNEKLETIDDTMTQYPMDFAQNEFDINTIYDLMQSDEPEKIQEFVNSLTPEAKSDGITHIDSGIPRDKLIELCNLICDKDYGKVNKEVVFDYVANQTPETIDDAIELIKHYKGTGCLNSYYAKDYLTPPNGDLKTYNKLLSYKSKFEEKNIQCYGSAFCNMVRNSNAIPEEVIKIFDYHLEKGLELAMPYDTAFTKPKGAYTYILQNEFPEISKYGYLDYYKEKGKDLRELAEACQNDEEFEFVKKLANESAKPDSEEFVPRFRENNYEKINDFKLIKDILELYRQDKETTLAVLNIKDNDGWYKYNNIDNIKNMVSAYQTDKDFIPEIEKARPNITTSDLKDIIEAKQIDADYTKELLTKENPDEEARTRNSHRKPYRVQANQIKTFVECAQIDKELTNKILNKNYLNEYNQFTNYTDYIMNEDLKILVELSQKDKELVDLLIDSPHNYKSYAQKGIPRFSGYGAVKIAKCITDENKDFIKDLIKTKNEKEEYEYTTNTILELANASSIDMEMTQNLMDEKIEEYNGELYPRFTSSDINELVMASKDGHKDIIMDLIKEIDKTSSLKTPKFNASFINAIVHQIKTDDDEKYLRELLQEKNYSQSDIHTFLSLKDEYSTEEIDKYRKLTVTNGETTKPMYYSETIKKLLYTEKNMPELMDSIKPRIRDIYDYHLETINNLEPELKTFVPQILGQKIKIQGEERYRYNSEDIKSMAILYKKYGEDAVNEFALQTMVETRRNHQRETLKYNTTEISNLLYVKTNKPEWFDIIEPEISKIQGDISDLIDTISEDMESQKELPKNKQTIAEMTKAEKRNMIAFIMKYKNSPDFVKFLMKNIGELPFMPMNDEEYEINMKELANSLKISLEPASETEIQKFNQVVRDIANGDDNLERFKDFVPQLEDMTTTSKMLERIRKNPEYNKLSDKDKEILTIATLLHNVDNKSNSTQDSAFDAFFIAKQFNMSNEDAQKIYTLIDASDTITKFMATNKSQTQFSDRGFNITGQMRQDTFDLIALNLKESNNFEMAKLLYSSKEKEGLTRYFDKLLEHRINEIKSSDFVLPQTEGNKYKENSKEQEIQRGENTYNVQVVNAKDMPELNAFIHSPTVAFTSGGSAQANFANFEAFSTLNDDRIICSCYINDKKYGPALQFHDGFIINVKNENQYVGYGRDIYSHSRNKGQLCVEYLRDKGLFARQNKGEKYRHRTMISDELKEILYGKDYDEKTCNADYILRLDKIKSQLGCNPITNGRLEEIDPEFAKAYKEFFSRNATDNHDDNEKILLRDDTYHNEVLVSNPEISAIFTTELNSLPEDYLKKSQQDNLPIVVFEKPS